jgi:hypothetical protein
MYFDCSIPDKVKEVLLLPGQLHEIVEKQITYPDKTNSNPDQVPRVHWHNLTLVRRQISISFRKAVPTNSHSSSMTYITERDILENIG